MAKLAVDLFCIGRRNYLVTVDYYSNFAEVDELPDITSQAAIKCLWVQFARHGVPCVVILDNGPQLVSCEFRDCVSSTTVVLV